MKTHTLTLFQTVVWLVCLGLSWCVFVWKLHHPYWRALYWRYPFSWFWRVRKFEDVYCLYSLAREEPRLKFNPSA
jgi:hypothetical protein